MSDVKFKKLPLSCQLFCCDCCCAVFHMSISRNGHVMRSNLEVKSPNITNLGRTMCPACDTCPDHGWAASVARCAKMPQANIESTHCMAPQLSRTKTDGEPIDSLIIYCMGHVKTNWEGSHIWPNAVFLYGGHK